MLSGEGLGPKRATGKGIDIDGVGILILFDDPRIYPLLTEISSMSFVNVRPKSIFKESCLIMFET